MIKYYKLNFYIQSKNYATQKLNNGFIFDHAPPPQHPLTHHHNRHIFSSC